MEEILLLTTEVTSTIYWISAITFFIEAIVIFLLCFTKKKTKYHHVWTLYLISLGIIALLLAIHTCITPYEQRELIVTDQEFAEICIDQNVDPVLMAEEINNTLGPTNNHSCDFLSEEYSELLDVESVITWYSYLQENE